MTALEAITLALAVVGTVTGTASLWLEMRRDREGLRVRMIVAYPGAYALHGRPCLAIEVVNLSGFAITITEVGFRLGREKDRLRLEPFTEPARASLPALLNPRDSVTFYTGPGAEGMDLHRLRAVYAVTATGARASGAGKMVRIVERLGRLPAPLKGPPPGGILTRWK